MELIGLSKSRVKELGIKEEKLSKYIEGHSRYNTDLYSRVYENDIYTITGKVLNTFVSYDTVKKEDESFHLYIFKNEKLELLDFPETFKDFELLTLFSKEKLYVHISNKEGDILFKINY